MRWDDESYVRIFKRTTADWSLVPGLARSLFYTLLREVDRAGILPMRKGLAGVARLIDWPAQLVEEHVPHLLEDGCLRREGDCLVVPNYIAAQETPQNDAQRKRSQRERDRADLLSKPDRISVTPGHAESHPVTSCHSEQSSTEQSSTEHKGEEAPPARTKQAPGHPPPESPPVAAKVAESAAILEQLHREAGGKLKLGLSGDWPPLPDELSRFHELLTRFRPPPEHLRKMGLALKAGDSFWRTKGGKAVALRVLLERGGELWVELAQVAAPARASPVLSQTDEDPLKRGEELPL